MQTKGGDMDMRKRAGLVLRVIGFILVSGVSTAHAQSPAITSGLQWLQAQVQSDGSLSNENSSVATPLQVRGEAALALNALATSPSALLAGIGANTDTDAESIARRIQALSISGADTSTQVQLLLTQQNPDGGFGLYPGDSSDPLDTAWALIALHAAGSTNATVLDNALTYLLQNANSDGGYGIPDGGSGSQVYITAYVLIALQSYTNSYTLTTPIASTRQWLINQQVNGAYADVLTNAIAVRALAATTTDSSTFAGATAVLTSAQLADGSWGDDPYLTALALDALNAANQPPAPTTGGLTGVVLANGSGLPIDGAQIQASGPALASATTGTDGAMQLTGLVPGVYTVSVTSNGYGSETFQNVQVTAGANTNLGTITLGANATSATLTGRVTDGATGSPLAGVTVTLSGADSASATTATDGTYTLADLAPGTVTITVTLVNYNTVTAAATLATGTVFTLSPTLYVTGTTAGSTSLSGVVEDAASTVPIAGATVTVNGTSATTDASGKFTVDNLATGSFTASITAAGYGSASLTGTLAPGVNTTGTVLLTQGSGASVSTVSGTVTDAQSKAPIVGATIQIQGTTLTAVTGADGAYVIGNVSATHFSVLISAPGYISQTGNVSLTAPGNVTTNAALNLNAASGITVKSVTLAQPNYNPFTEAEIDSEIDNTTASDTQVLLSAQVVDSLGNVVANIPAVPLSLGQTASDAAKTVPAGGSLDQDFTFYVQNTPSGTYHLTVQATDLNGNVLAQNGSTIVVNALAQIGGGITLNPPLSQIGSQQPISITANISNLGNLPLSAGALQLKVTLADAGTSVQPEPQVSDYYVGSPLAAPMGTAEDSQGNLYLVDHSDCKVSKIAPDKTATVIATIQCPWIGNTYTHPADTALDPAGDVWVLYDSGYVTEIKPDGTVVSPKATGLRNQYNFTIDKAGNFYITGIQGNDRVLAEWHPGSSPVILERNGLSSPNDITKDSLGNFYVTNYADNTVSEISATGVITTFVSGLNRPQGIESDSAGNLYVANSGANDILKIAPDGSTSVFASGFDDPYSIRFDSQLNEMLVTNEGDNSISAVSMSGAVTPFSISVANTPQGMRYDSAGDLYIANAGTNTLAEIDAQGHTSIVSTSLNAPRDVAINASNQVFVANYGSGSISEVTGGNTTVFKSGLSDPYGMAFDGSGNLYVTEYNANQISELGTNGSVLSVTSSLISAPQPMWVENNGSLLVGNNGFISNVPLEGGGNIVVSNVGSVVGLLQTTDGTIYYTNNYGLYKRNDDGSSTEIVSLPYTASAPVVDSSGNFYVGDYNNHKILEVDPSGVISTFATLPGTPTSMIRDATGNIYVIVSTKDIYKIAPDGATTLLTTQPGALSHLAFATDGQILVTTYTSGTVLKIASDGTATTVLSGLANPTGIASFADGRIAIAELNQNRIRIFTPQGVQVSSVYGFSGPKGIVWDGQRLVFNDARNNFYSLIPGQYPQLLASNATATYVAALNGNVYFTAYPGVVMQLDSTGHMTTYYTTPGSAYDAGIAFAPDGGMTLGLYNNNEVLELTAAKQVKTEYWGLYQPMGLAIDETGNVFVANSGKRNIMKISPSGDHVDIYASMWQETGLAFDSDGNLYASGNQYTYGTEGIYKVGPGGSVKEAYTTPGDSVLDGFLFDGANLFVVDDQYQMVRSANNGTLKPFAVGIAGPRGVRMAPDGSLFVVDNPTGAVLHYVAGSLALVASGLSSPQSINLDSAGNAYVGGSGGSFVKIAADGQVTNLNIAPVLAGSNIVNIAFDTSGDPLITESNKNIIQTVTIPAPVVPPSVGSVVYSTSIAAPALSSGGDSTQLNFGSWTPQFGGDYTFTITSAQSGVAGQAVDTLHVGPSAHGVLTANTGVTPPGDQAVALNLAVQGADFSTIAKVDPANLTTAVPTGAYPQGLEEDPAGNIDFISSGKLQSVSSTGVISTIYQGVANIKGQLPIDSQGNIYAPASGSGPYPILKITSSGTATTLATLSSQPRSMAMTNDSDLYVLTANGQVSRISQDGTVQLIYSGISSPFALTEDGQGTLYVQEGSIYSSGNQMIILKITPDGHASTLTSGPPYFEYEGNNIAGDCADDLFLTPNNWSAIGQSGGEEHVLGEIVGSTGQVGAVFDGFTMKPQLYDMDYIVYDRFHSNLLIWTDESGGRIYSLPVTCGAIDTEAHVVVPAGQSLTGFDVPPLATMSHTDGSTEYVWDLKDVQASGQSINFDTVLNALKLGETRPTVQSAFLVFKNTFVPGEVQVPLAVPSIQVGPLVTLTTTTDATSYAPNSPVAITVGLNNTYGTAGSGTLDIQIQDVSGADVADIQQQAESVAPNSLQTVTATWNTGNTLIGVYKVHAELVSSNGTVLAEADAPFGIDTGSTTTTGYVTAGVTVDKVSYAPTDTVNIDSRLTNVTANALADTLSVVTTLKNPDGSVRWSSTASIAQLVPGALRDLTYGVPLADAPPGTYSVSVVVSSGGATMATSQASLTVESSAATGAGLTGTLTTSPSDVPLTESLMLTGSVTNAGNAAIPDVTATLSILDPITQQIVYQSPTTLGTLTQGQSNAVVANWTVAGTINQTYVAILSTVINGKTLTLAQANFKVLPPPIKIDASMSLGQHGRVLILTDDPAAYPADQDPFGPTGVPGLALQDQHLAQMLYDAGWSATIVTNATDFETQFDTGGYEVYVILSEAVKLPTALQNEVVQAVNNGVGLIVAGNHDDRNNKLEDALGIHTIGKNLTATGLSLDPGSLDQAGGQANFPVDAEPASVNKVFATPVGEFLLSNGGTAPAVFTYQYGSGKSIYMAFDLALEEAAAGDNSLFDRLMLDSLDYVHPATLTPYTGSVLPIMLTLDNEGIPTPGRALVTLPPGVTVIDPHGATVNGNTLTWTFDLTSQGEVLPLTFWARMPDQSESIDFSTEVQSGTDPNFMHQATADLLIGVVPRPTPQPSNTHQDAVITNTSAGSANSRQPNTQ